MGESVALFTIPESPHLARELRARSVEVFGADGAWLLLSQLWYGWRTYYDLACGLVDGRSPSDDSRRPVPIGNEYRIAVDLQVQAYVYAAAEQFATLVYAITRHEPRTSTFFEAYVGAPLNLGDLIEDIGSIDRDKLIEFVGDPAAARMSTATTRPSLDLDPASIPTVTVGGIEVPKASIDRQAFENAVAGANEVIDRAIKNFGELRQLIDSPEPTPGADRQPQSLRAVDNSFRHGLRVLFHEAAPASRTFRVGALAAPPAQPSVDLYLPSRGKNASGAINFATVSCTPERTRGHLETLRQLSIRTGQVLRAFIGFQTTGTPDLLLSAAYLELPPPPEARFEATSPPAPGSAPVTDLSC